jgi:hypothetical protein
MKKLSKAEVSVLKMFMQGDAWDLILRLLGGRISELQAADMTGQNAFETLRALHLRDGGVTELKKFFDDLERGAFSE